VLGSVAQFEKELMLERTMAGLRAAKAEGRIGGRQRKLKPQDLAQARKHMTEGKLKAREVAKMYASARCGATCAGRPTLRPSRKRNKS
jgi:DNA invertase Pin-like site-specific DNA recombinase